MYDLKLIDSFCNGVERDKIDLSEILYYESEDIHYFIEGRSYVLKNDRFNRHLEHILVRVREVKNNNYSKDSKGSLFCVYQPSERTQIDKHNILYKPCKPYLDSDSVLVREIATRDNNKSKVLIIEYDSILLKVKIDSNHNIDIEVVSSYENQLRAVEVNTHIYESSEFVGNVRYTEVARVGEAKVLTENTYFIDEGYNRDTYVRLLLKDTNSSNVRCIAHYNTTSKAWTQGELTYSKTKYTTFNKWVKKATYYDCSR